MLARSRQQVRGAQHAHPRPTEDGIADHDALATVDVYNNIIYKTATGAGAGIRVGTALTTGRVRLFNNTIYGNTLSGITGSAPAPTTLRNNMWSATPATRSVTAGPRDPQPTT